MAQFLVRIHDQTHPDSQRDKWLTKKGCVIVVKDDAGVWGGDEDKRVWLARHGSYVGWPNNTIVLHVQDMTLAEARKFTKQWWRPASVLDAEYQSPDEADRRVLVKRRRWVLDWVKVFTERPDWYATLKDIGYLSVTYIDFKNYMRSNVTGVLYDGVAV